MTTTIPQPTPVKAPCLHRVEDGHLSGLPFICTLDKGHEGEHSDDTEPVEAPVTDFTPLGAAIEASMLSHGVSVAAAAKTIGRSPATLARRLSRPRTFKINEVAALGLALEGDVVAFFRVPGGSR
jgi:hypothetical protein